MTDIIIRRVGESEYQLEIDGSVVQTYNQTEMTHPWDWAADAKNNGVSDSDIRLRNYRYVDDR